MIQCRPKLKNKLLIITSLFLIVLSVLLFAVSQISGNFAAIIQISAIGAATASLFFLIKYVIPDYLYTLDNERLTVHKVTKAQSVCVVDIELNTVRTLPITGEEYKKQKAPRRLYSFIKNPGTPSLRYLIFELNGDEYALLLEPDELFCRELEKALSEHLSNNNYDCEDNNLNGEI